jgi:hypothetical protein
VIVNSVPIKQAICAYELQGTIPRSTVYSRVATARARGTYDVLINSLRRDEKIQKIVVEVHDSDWEEDQAPAATGMDDSTISPITMQSLLSVETTTTTDSTIRTPSIKKSRKSPRQASLARLETKRVKTEYDGRYKAAFKNATNFVAARNTLTGGGISSHRSVEPIEDVCKRLNQKFGLDGKKLNRSTVYRGVKDGFAGKSPQKRGPAPKIPNELLEVIALHAEVCQMGEGELKGRDFKRLIGAAKLGTPYEKRFGVEAVWRKVRAQYPHALQAASRMTVEDARAQWTTHDNLDQWFDDAKADLLSTGLVDDIRVVDENGALLSEVTFKQDVTRRIINMDETHHDLSITGDKGGSRSVSYHNPTLQRGANRGVKSARHVTGAYATTAAGEALPPFYIFDSSAKCEENFRVRVEWLAGLPTISGRFGCPTQVECDSFYAVRPRGSMDEYLLNQYIESVIVPLYPNMHKTAVFDPITGKLNQGPVILKLDAGPGRIVSSSVILAKREELFERGLIILMGLPNATSVQQEMDALYGAFKSATYARGEKIVQHKLKSRGRAMRNGEKLKAAVLSLDFSDLATVVNGVDGDVITDRPFDCNFSRAKILGSWAKIGFVPFTRNCLNNIKVRKELGQNVRDLELEGLQLRYDVAVDVVEAERRLNPGIFDATIPSAVHVDRAATKELQVQELLKGGKAFSASGLWNMCESRIGNAGVTLRAQKRQHEINEEARLKVVDKKTQANLKALEKAQIAMERYTVDGNSLSDKDWGDIVRWVLPEANVTFLLKDLKKKDQIVAKLATLPNDWTSYIPSRVETTIAAV